VIMVAELFNLQGKKILVTGASRGIGHAVARELAELGSEVYGTGRSPPEMVENLNFSYIQSDITSKENRQKIIADLPESLDCLFLNAGASGTIKPFHLVDEDEARGLFDLNFFSPYFFFQELYKAKKIKPGCAVVINTAHGAFFPGAASSAYCATKGALQSGFKSVSHDLSKRKIRINYVAFGYVDTDLLRSNNVSAESKSRPPLGVPRPEEVTGPVIYLLSDASRWLSGSTIMADAGICLKQVPFL
jgi:NAD(P)-dependent dehydrogenase (short-subunit alcohol dehydrogenase family)